MNSLLAGAGGVVHVREWGARMCVVYQAGKSVLRLFLNRLFTTTTYLRR